VIDSIQTVWLPESEAYAGSIYADSRLHASAEWNIQSARAARTFIVGHVTKDGAIAGPRLLEHLVDTVLYFEGEANGEYRILRAYKNRFGSVDENLRLLDARFGFARSLESIGALCGSAHAATQRLVRRRIDRRFASRAHRGPGTGRRNQLRYAATLANNLRPAAAGDDSRVLERAARAFYSERTNVTQWPAGCASASLRGSRSPPWPLLRRFGNAAVPSHIAVFGELGLSGEVRAVGGAERREAEARKLGYDHVISPANTATSSPRSKRTGNNVRLFEIVPNLSEGRNAATIDAAIAAVEATGRASLEIGAATPSIIAAC